MTSVKQMIWVLWMTLVLLFGMEQTMETVVPVPTATVLPTPTVTPSPTVTPIPTPTVTPTPTEKAEYTFTEMNQEMYAMQDVNVRSLPNSAGKILGVLWNSDAILVTGKCKEVNWYRVEYEGETAYVYGKYLSEAEPTKAPLPPIEYANSFCVDEDGTIYVLDLYGRKLVETDGEQFVDILLPGCVLPADVRLQEEKFYIYDEVLNEVLVYDKNGNLLEEVPVPISEDYVKRFENGTEEVALLTYGGKRMVLSDEGTFVTEEYEEKAVASDGFDFVEYLGEDVSGNRYSLNTTLVKDCSVLAGEIMICVSSPEGEFLFGYNIPVLECIWLPDHYVRFTEDGSVYVLMVKEDEVVVECVTLETSPKSQLALIEKKAKNTEATYKKESDARFENKKTYTKAITLTREEVYERAVAMTEYVWTLKPENIDSSVARNARLPRYIAALTEQVQGQSSWEILMTGIPYCWGGFNSLYGSKSTRFETVISENGYFAGNINSTGEYRKNTAGIDCSGYVSTLLGVSWKLNTRQCSDLGSARTDRMQLEQMDILVAPGDHVVLFVGWLDDGTILATEAAIRDGRVTMHPRTINSFLVEGTFQMRSPW